MQYFRLRLDKLGLDRQTDGDCEFLSSCRSQKWSDLNFLHCLVVREVGNLDEAIGTSEDEEQPLNVEMPDLIHPTGCPKKNYTLFWGALAPTFFELCLKVGGVSESPRVDASFAYNSFSVALNTPEIFEFKVGRLQKKV